MPNLIINVWSNCKGAPCGIEFGKEFLQIATRKVHKFGLGDPHETTTGVAEW